MGVACAYGQSALCPSPYLEDLALHPADGVGCWVRRKEAQPLGQHPAKLRVVLVRDGGLAGATVGGHEALPDVFKEAKGDPAPKRLCRQGKGVSRGRACAKGEQQHNGGVRKLEYKKQYSWEVLSGVLHCRLLPFRLHGLLDHHPRTVPPPPAPPTSSATTRNVMPSWTMTWNMYRS